jgi:hypothetical protein
MAGKSQPVPSPPSELSDGWKDASHKQVFAGLRNHLSSGDFRDHDTMYVGLLVIAVLGFVFSLVLDEIERMLIPWKANA